MKVAHTNFKLEIWHELEIKLTHINVRIDVGSGELLWRTLIALFTVVCTL